jgi:hypothetical protein
MRSGFGLRFVTGYGVLILLVAGMLARDRRDRHRDDVRQFDLSTAIVGVR